MDVIDNADDTKKSVAASADDGDKNESNDYNDSAATDVVVDDDDSVDEDDEIEENIYNVDGDEEAFPETDIWPANHPVKYPFKKHLSSKD